jgi:pimeloyl-ACP methyl ester carboxylesterase
MKIARKWFIPEKLPRVSWQRWIFERLAVMLLLMFVISIGSGFLFKNHLIFQPDSALFATPKDHGLAYEEKWLTLPNGLKMNAWRIVPPPGGSGQTVLLFSGNGGNMSQFPQWAALSSLGLTVMAVDYPGYGQSEGRPSEEGTYQAAEALWQWAISQKAAPESILLYGFSLGGGVASQLAVRHLPAALILDSTFTRLRDVPSVRLPAFASLFHLVLGNAFDTKSRLAEIRCPLLVIHSREDNTVSFRLGNELFETYRSNRKEMVIGDGDHLDFFLNQPDYLKRIQEFLKIPARKT